MSFYHLPHPYNPGYAIPDYVMAEPPGRGTFTTKWLPRGTISQIIPDFLAKPGKQLVGGSLGSLDGTVFEGNSLATNTLAGSTLEGDTLGAREYNLESLGRGPARYEDAGAFDLSTAKMILPFALIGGAIWFFTRKKARANPARGARRRRVARRRRSRR